MSYVVVDTDIVSFQFKDHTLADLYDPFLAGRSPLISFMTMAEVEQWSILVKRGPLRRERMDLHLTSFTVIPSSDDLCRKWAEVMVTAQRAGRGIECADAWIAATALLYDVPLITHN